MIIHDVVQRTAEWDALREKCWPGSVAPAMRGESPYVKRDEAIAMAATGSPRQFSDWVLKNIIEKGHEIEANGRAIAEEMLGEDLYPATVTEDIPGLSRPLLSSLDGMTMDGQTIYECKQYNAELFAAVRDGDCLSHRFQVVQGLLITNAKRCLFMVTDGSKEKTATCWLTLGPDGEEARDLIAGWKQFEADVKNYTPQPAMVEVVGATIKELPALMVRVEGRVVDSNLGVFRQAARDLVAAIKTDLQDDQDFADADKATKWLKDGEDRLELVKKQAQSQAATIDDLFRTIDEIREGMRDKRLMLEKLVKTRKEAIRAEIVTKARMALANHIRSLTDRLAAVAKNWWPKGIKTPAVVFNGENFAGVIKGLKSIDSLRDKVNTELARCTIETNKIADAMQSNLTTLALHAPQHAHLFTDAEALMLKTPEDLTLVIADRLSAEQARIEREEAARAATAAAIATAQQPPAAALTAAKPSESQPVDVTSASAESSDSQLSTSQAVGAAVIYTGNTYLVGVRSDDTIVIARLRPDYQMTKASALNLAAWLVAAADDHDEFPALLQAIRNT
jgi:predicted phage-related endonuclease